MFVIKKSPKGLSSFVLGSWLYLLLYTFMHASVLSWIPELEYKDMPLKLKC